mmetsp:Transcript_18773/g.43438  ORF Transcript_18773/g.43438 Transcript_18773/m.43438 type:complete len:86 (-) Transcript_18773:82-339(-)
MFLLRIATNENGNADSGSPKHSKTNSRTDTEDIGDSDPEDMARCRRFGPDRSETNTKEEGEGEGEGEEKRDTGVFVCSVQLLSDD